MSNAPQNQPGSPAGGAGTENRVLDVLINLVGVAAILLMLFAVVGSTSQGAALKIPASAVGPARNGGWVCIGLYILGSLWQSRAWLAQIWRRERTQTGTNLLVQLVLSVAIIGAINWIGTRQHKRWDLTENKQFSLSDQSRKVVKALPGKVKVTMFINPADRSNQQNRDLWKEYTYVDSTKVEFTEIDADRKPAEAQKFLDALPELEKVKIMQSGRINAGTMVIDYNGKLTNMTGYNEQDFTSALIKATRSSQKTLYWVEGHGESDPESYGPEGMGQFKQTLEKQNYKIEKLALFARKTVPDDAAALVIAAPQRSFEQNELDMLATYVKRGGRIHLVLGGKADPKLDSWLSKTYGLTPERKVVMERDANRVMSFDPRLPVVVKYPWHNITQPFQNRVMITVFPMARSLKVEGTRPEGMQIDSLAETSDKAEARAFDGDTFNAQALTRPFDEKRDSKGPLKLSVAVTVTTPNPAANAPVATRSAEQPKEFKGRLVVISSPHFAANQFAQSGQIANSDFFLAGLNWLAEEEALISIPPKSTETRTIEMVGRTQAYLGLGTVAFPPIALMLIGGFVWWRRR
jgi:ABC-type uncharacterized transport system involved in gliding motility auxiliary subunit